MTNKNRTKTKAPVVQDYQPLRKLPANRGGYYYLTVEATVVAGFSQRHKTRLQCVLNEAITLSCGLNPLGDGRYFIIVASRYVKALKRKEGDGLSFRLTEDENPLGVSVPEVLEALLEQDEELKAVYDVLSDGKKRSLIFLIKDIKNIDKQVQKATKFLQDVKHNRSPYQHRR